MNGYNPFYGGTYPSAIGEFIHVPNEQVGRLYQVFPGNVVRMLDDSRPDRMYIKEVPFATKIESFRIIEMKDITPPASINQNGNMMAQPMAVQPVSQPAPQSQEPISNNTEMQELKEQVAALTALVSKLSEQNQQKQGKGGRDDHEQQRQ